MNDEATNAAIDRALVGNLIRRFVPDAAGNHVLQGPITADELQALRALVGRSTRGPGEPDIDYDGRPPEIVEGPQSDRRGDRYSARPYEFGAPARLTPSIRLSLVCLSAQPDPGDVVAIDFGTAFSKAALWEKNADGPTPLPLAKGLTGVEGWTLDSALYVTEGVVHFGPYALDVSRRENNPERLRFDSPKQELSLVQGHGLDEQVGKSVDPTGRLSKRDMLTLYLAFLSATTSEELRRESADPYALRKFAVPVWKDIQLAKVARLLKRLLVDAQIIADTTPAEAWTKGLSVDDAKRILGDLNQTLTDEQRDRIAFIGGHVTEAGAAAAAIGERLSNRRPIALVMDVGAGTTDLGLYRFRLAGEEQNRIFPFEHGGRAIKMAGDYIDNRLIDFLKSAARLDEHTAHGRGVLSVLRRDIRIIKADLFASNRLDHELLGDVEIKLEDFLNSNALGDLKKKLRAEVHELISAVGSDRLKQPDGHHVVLTGGGSGVSVFREVFDEPFVFEEGKILFQMLDVQPTWLESYPPAMADSFPQLAVSVGACSPFLPDEGHPISDASVAEPRILAPNYKS